MFKRFLLTMVMIFCIVSISNADTIYYNDGGVHEINGIYDEIVIDQNSPSMGTIVNFRNGAISSSLRSVEAHEDSKINVYGGEIYNGFYCEDNVQLNIVDGNVRSFQMQHNGTVNFSMPTFFVIFYENYILPSP